MIYTKWKYIYPPRPSTAISFKSEAFERLKKKNWIAQYKLNGQRNMIVFTPDGNIEYWNRHNEIHRNWNCPEWLEKKIEEYRPSDGEFTILDGELIHAKHSSIKNTFYIWDVLVYKNDYFLFRPYYDRYKILLEIFDIKNSTDPIIKLDEHIWIANNLENSIWDQLWDKASEESIIEGFVIKNPNSRLKPGIKEKNNGDWQVRCRKPTKSYRF